MSLDDQLPESIDRAQQLISATKLAIDAMIAAFPNGDFTPEELRDKIRNREMGPLAFSHHPERLNNILEINVRLPKSEDLNIPIQIATSKHRSQILILEVTDLDMKKHDVAVVVKALNQSEALAELTTYESIADNLQHLDIYAFIGEEYSERPWIFISVANPHLLAVQTKLRSLSEELRELAEAAKSFKVEDEIRLKEEVIAKQIVSGYHAFLDLHRLGLVHGDPASRNVLINTQNDTLFAMDFETTKPSDLAQVELEKATAIGSFLAEIEEEFTRVQIEDWTREILTKSLSYISARVRELIAEIN